MSNTVRTKKANRLGCKSPDGIMGNWRHLTDFPAASSRKTPFLLTLQALTRLTSLVFRASFEFLNNMYKLQQTVTKHKVQSSLDSFYFFSMSRRKFWGPLYSFFPAFGVGRRFLEHAISAADGAAGGSPTARGVCRQFGTFCIHRESNHFGRGKIAMRSREIKNLASSQIGYERNKF